VWWAEGQDACREWLLANAAEIDEKEAAKVVGMLTHYNPPRDDYDWVRNEEPFEIGVVGPDGEVLSGVRVIGYADSVLIRKKDGKKVVRECKTTASQILGYGPYWGRLGIDGQIGLYANAFNVDTVIYDVLRKPQIRPSKVDKALAMKLNETKQPTGDQILQAYTLRVCELIAKEPVAFHQWRPIHITPLDHEVAARNLYDSVRHLQFAEESGCFPMHPGSCTNYSGCKFLDVCCGRADINDPVRFRDKLTRAEIQAQKGKA
jgi:hypothetical protein